MGDGPHHNDAERDSREAEMSRLRVSRDQLLDFARLVRGAMDRADTDCVMPADRQAIERELARLL